MTAITRHELADTLYRHKELGFSKQFAKVFVNDFFESICFALQQGETVQLTGLGGFSVLNKSARPGRNPKTGEPVEISARRVVSFQASRNLKERLDEEVC